jgi:hypothetical protein
LNDATHPSDFISTGVKSACVPGESRQKEVRYPNIHEDDRLDEAQFAAWVNQASQLPSWSKA